MKTTMNFIGAVLIVIAMFILGACIGGIFFSPFGMYGQMIGIPLVGGMFAFFRIKGFILEYKQCQN